MISSYLGLILIIFFITFLDVDKITFVRFLFYYINLIYQYIYLYIYLFFMSFIHK